MLRSFGFFVLWVAGSAAAVAVAWAGVSFVDDELVKPTSPGLAAEGQVDTAFGSITATTTSSDEATGTATDVRTDDAQVNAAGASESIPPDSTEPPVDHTADALDLDSPAVTVETAPSTTRPPVRRTGTLAPTTTAVQVAPPTPTTASEAPTTVPAPTASVPTTTTAPRRTTTTTTTAPRRSQTLTFHLEGGSAAIKFSPGSVSLSWASPHPGFEVKVERKDGELKIEFESNDHESSVIAWWDGGPKYQIREKAED
ncbi:MAG: hypothetical protein P8N02_20370 [Actinomycetota bacterium]|nr:hypothetical protein [Actinomycetota bacterium]